MSLTVSDSGSTDFAQLPVGIYEGVCARLYDFGQQDNTYNGETKKRQELFIAFEITKAIDPADNVVLMEDGRPFMVGRTVTASLAEKAALRSMLEAWRGKAFTEQELQGFDVGNLLGLNARLEIGHTKPTAEYAGGKPKIISVNRPDGGAQQLPTVNPQEKFDLDLYLDNHRGTPTAASKSMADIFEGMSDWHQNKVQDSYDYKAVVGTPAGSMAAEVGELTDQAAAIMNPPVEEQEPSVGTPNPKIPF
jgi:hypothetical protein|tara:strand:- start:1586 stop:2332 length:747 start_codon:yes stop_codon:yes gene_type:complete